MGQFSRNEWKLSSNGNSSISTRNLDKLHVEIGIQRGAYCNLTKRPEIGKEVFRISRPTEEE